MRIGFIGLGAMGLGMAHNILAKHGQLATIAHRNRIPVDALVAKGAEEYADARALSSQCDVIFLCLPTSETVESTIREMPLRAGQIIVDTGTSSLSSTLAIAQELKAKDVAFAEAPLTGGQAQADAGELGALVGSTPETFTKIEPLLDYFCATTQHFSPVGSGARAKLINNYMVIGIAALVTEAFHTADETQTEWDQLYDVVIRGSADSGVFRRIIGNAKDGDFSGYVFSVANAAKDMAYITEMNADLGRDTPLNYAVKDLFDRAVELGFGERRISELLRPDVREKLFPKP